MAKALKTARGASSLLMISINTIVLTTLLCILAIGKLLAPTESFRGRVRNLLGSLAETWISVNNAILSIYSEPRWDVRIPGNLDRNGCYLVSSNHQSWVDILVLQRCFNRRLPFFRFFIKSQLFWVPFLGVAWWALDMPFMKRHSREKLARNPALKGRDLENARRACEKFRTLPVAMTNFPEGTRFSTRKRDATGSPYRNLLLPRVGGLGQVMFALSEQLDGMVDVTIVYPQSRLSRQAPTFWQLLTGDIPEIVVRAELREFPPELLGRNIREDAAFRDEMETWIHRIWQEKDTLISDLLDLDDDSENPGHQGDADSE